MVDSKKESLWLQFAKKAKVVCGQATEKLFIMVTALVLSDCRSPYI